MTATEFKVHLNGILTRLEMLPDKIATESADLFDQNFEQEGFFGNKWKQSMRTYRYEIRGEKNGKTLQDRGALRKSIQYTVNGNTIVFTSNVPYASIHNEGGVIKHPGGTAYTNILGGASFFISNLGAAGHDYKRTKPHDIPMPQRQFVGGHPALLAAIEDLIAKAIELRIEN